MDLMRLLRLWAGERVAIDLGTARTRIRLPQRGVSMEAPSVIASDGWGNPRLAGWDAWACNAGQRYAPDAPLRLVWPLHAGVVSNAPACGRLLRLLLKGAGRRPGRRALIVLGVPAGAGEGDRETAVTAVAEAVGGRVTTVDEPLAAAIGAGIDMETVSARLLVDIGAGLTEVAVVGRDGLLASHSVSRGATAFTPSLGTRPRTPPDRSLPDSGRDALELLAVAVTQVLESLGTRQRAIVVGRGLLLTGGGALVPGLAAQLSAAVGLAVTTASVPAYATIDGLTQRLGSTTRLRGSASGRSPAIPSSGRGRVPAK